MKMMLGSGAATNSFNDIEHARTILICGANATENHPVLGARIKQAVRRGTRLIGIDPRRIELAGLADFHLAVQPGTNVPLRTETRKSTGFRALQVVSVSSSNVPQIEKASREITSLLEQGVFVTSDRPNYYYTRLGELKLEMLSEAAKDARSRAENILSSAGKTNIGALVDSSMGIININPANSTETSNEGNNDTSSYEKDIITIVRAEYKVN
jgi:NADH dehydrogenase/NADH:ubiquinone oxidoreductase subunit G